MPATATQASFSSFPINLKSIDIIHTALPIRCSFSLWWRWVTYLRTTFHLLPVLAPGFGVSGSLSNVLPNDVFDVDRAGPLADWVGTHGNGRHSWLKYRTTRLAYLKFYVRVIPSYSLICIKVGWHIHCWVLKFFIHLGSKHYRFPLQYVLLYFNAWVGLFNMSIRLKIWHFRQFYLKSITLFVWHNTEQ